MSRRIVSRGSEEAPSGEGGTPSDTFAPEAGWGIPYLVAGLFLLNAVLLAPRWLAAGGLAPPWIALEAMVVVGVLCLLPRERWALRLAGVVGVLVLPIMALALADALARLSLARPLNLYLDVRLAGAVWNLMVGSLGSLKAGLWAGGGALALAALTGGLTFLFLRLPSSPWRTPRRYLGSGVLLLAVAGSGWSGGPEGRQPGRVAGATFLTVPPATPLVDLAREQHRYFTRMMGERERFALEMAAVPGEYSGVPGLFQGLGGRDVILAFVESYGMSALEDPRYAPVIRPRLEELERRMDGVGLSLATGRLVAPIQGGQSWLGHGSVLTGLWLSNQYRYELFLAGTRESLVDDFHRAGYASAGVVPAITMAWPEGERFRYGEVFDHARIPYRGPPLNWVTMPDQFTWCFLEYGVRRRERSTPLFLEVALISSHAPWTPILPVLSGCAEVGDGAAFQPWADAGERPEELWLNTDRVREHYALAVEYALHAMTTYAESYVDDDLLLIVLGDHQPAPLITGDSATLAVPVHVIARDPALLEPFLEWGFTSGAFPPAEGPEPRMDLFRHWFVTAFSTGGEE